MCKKISSEVGSEKMVYREKKLQITYVLSYVTYLLLQNSASDRFRLLSRYEITLMLI